VVLRDHADHYAREGMFWKPYRRFLGNGIMGEGPRWAASRKIIQPHFTSAHVDALIDQMITVVDGAADGLERRRAAGGRLDVVDEMTRLTHSAVIKVFFGDRIPATRARRVAKAIDVAGASANARLLLPFVPHAIPLPGDHAFNRAIRDIDDVMIPLVRKVRAGSREGADMVATLCRAHTEGTARQCERRVRDDVVSMFTAASETTAMTLAWFWIAMTAHPQVYARVRQEVTDIVSGRPLTRQGVGDLRYVRAALQETLRLYPPGWIIPRTAVTDNDIGGVRIPRGATVLVSPYVTQRMASLWERPLEFDPTRFAAEHPHRHRYAFFPFSGGPHHCLGSHFFTVEAQIIVASILKRFRPEVVDAATIGPRVGATLRPRGRVTMVLHPWS
jgi:enediyne biosynthesis protein E7